MATFPPVHFLLSVAELAQLPQDKGTEVAFIGRSNVGKSSAINAIIAKKGLAKTSKTPGCTRLLSFFQITQQRRLVDLPGYGYAQVGHAVKDHWQKLLTQYLASRRSLRGLILLVDSRHTLKSSDQAVLIWAIQHALPLHILLTKTDKLSSMLATQRLQYMQTHLAQSAISATCQLFSAMQPTGLQSARQQILHWLA